MKVKIILKIKVKINSEDEEILREFFKNITDAEKRLNELKDELDTGTIVVIIDLENRTKKVMRLSTEGWEIHKIIEIDRWG